MAVALTLDTPTPPCLQAHERAGHLAVRVLRRSFDWASGYGPGMSERQWLRRILFLETIAGVPGMVAGERLLFCGGQGAVGLHLPTA